MIRRLEKRGSIFCGGPIHSAVCKRQAGTMLFNYRQAGLDVERLVEMWRFPEAPPKVEGQRSH